MQIEGLLVAGSDCARQPSKGRLWSKSGVVCDLLELLEFYIRPLGIETNETSNANNVHRVQRR